MENALVTLLLLLRSGTGTTTRLKWTCMSSQSFVLFMCKDLKRKDNIIKIVAAHHKLVNLLDLVFLLCAFRIRCYTCPLSET